MRTTLERPTPETRERIVQDHLPRRDGSYLPWLGLAMGLLLLLIGNGKYTVALAAWLWIPALLTFTRARIRAGGWIVTWVGIATVASVSWSGLIPFHGWKFWAYCFGFAAVSLLPFAFDRRLRKRVGGFAATLGFPLAFVTIEYLLYKFTPGSTWGSLAYTQVCVLPVAQTVSIAGIWGLSFVMAWFGPVLLYSVEHRSERAKLRGPLWYGVAVLSLFIWGGLRLALAPQKDSLQTLTAGAIALPKSAANPWPLLRGSLTAVQLTELKANLRKEQDELFNAAARAVASGAKVVVWSELNASVLRDDLPALQARAQAFAKSQKVVLGLGIGVFTPGRSEMENTMLIVEPSGNLTTYHKAHPAPGDPEFGGDLQVPVVDSSIGKVSGAICFDADFPSTMSRSGKEGADVILLPTSDWKDIDPMHTEMTQLRAIENGIPVVRAARFGLSALIDSYGRVVSSQDFFWKNGTVLVGELPSQKAWTLYPRIGDLFAWLALLGTAGMFAASRRPKKKLL